MTNIKWLDGPPKDPDNESEFLTYVPHRRSGALQYCDSRISLKRQLHANRRGPFRLYRKVPGTFNYELAAVIHRVPDEKVLEYVDLDDFIDDLLA